MEQRTNAILFALLRSALRGGKLAREERECVSPELLAALLETSSRHDIVHLLVLGLKQNDLLPSAVTALEKHILKAVYRSERLKGESVRLSAALEAARIPFVPLKGTVLREYYPEPWMRTSCDIDILVHKEDLEKAAAYLAQKLQYEEKERSTHDISLFSPQGNRIELHFDLVEEGRANNAIGILRGVWENVSPRKGYQYQYEMTDAFFYFYHIAHMAKHFENGGCGIRPFIDLWILDHMDGVDRSKRDSLLAGGGLLPFANAARRLSGIWLDGWEADALSMRLQEYILHGGIYGSSENRVVLQQKKKGGRLGYLLSRVFVPYTTLKRYYPVLEKHRWLLPFMQVRRWFMLLKPDVAGRTRRELLTNGSVKKAEAEEMNALLKSLGLS